MFLPTGRVEHRIAKIEVVELLHVGESPVAKVEAITENVSNRRFAHVQEFYDFYLCNPVFDSASRQKHSAAHTSHSFRVCWPGWWGRGNVGTPCPRRSNHSGLNSRYSDDSLQKLK